MTDPERLQLAVGEALEFLGRAGKSTGGPAQLSERVVSRGDAKVRKQLADAVYDLARRCIQAHEKTGRIVTFGAREPRQLVDLKSTIGPLAERASVAKAEVETIEPSASSSVPIKEALEVLRRLEGTSDSWNSLVAIEAMARDDWETGLVASRRLAQHGTTAKWRASGALNSVTALMQLDRFKEAEELLHDISRTTEPDQTHYYNLACAHAMQGKVEKFNESVSAMRDCCQGRELQPSWTVTIEDQIDDLCRGTKQSASQIRAAFGVEGPDE